MSHLANALNTLAGQKLHALLLGFAALTLSSNALSLASDKQEKVTWEAAGN